MASATHIAQDDDVPNVQARASAAPSAIASPTVLAAHQEDDDNKEDNYRQ